jgi:nucleoside-diphosphate-sugar epimerase
VLGPDRNADAVNRTLITGVAGFTGRYLAKQLSEQGHDVHGLVHGGDVAELAGVSDLHRADLADGEAVQAVIDKVRPTHVVHLAAIAFVGHGDVSEMYRSNVLGTRQLLQALASLTDKPKAVLLASSGNVYGNAREGILDEAVPTAPANDYGVTKVAMEYVAGLYRARLPITIARPFNYTGRGQDASFLIPKIVDHLARRADRIELGNLDVSRDFSDVRMVVDAYARLLDAPASAGETFNICSGIPVSLREVIEMGERAAGHRMEVRVNPAFVRADEVRTLAGSAAKLERLIGPLKRMLLEETLRWMLEP